MQARDPAWARRARRWREGGHLIEFAAVASAGFALFTLAMSAWLVTTAAHHARSPNQLLAACQYVVSQGPLVTAGYIAAGALAAWSLVVLGRLGWRARRDLPAAWRQGQALGSCEEAEVWAGGAAVSVRLLEMEPPAAFVAGFIHPRIYVSTGLLRKAAPLELEAAVLHEVAHRRRRDPLRCWLVDLALTSLYLPGTGWLCAAYRAAREASADAEATARMGDDRPLLRAIAMVAGPPPVAAACSLGDERARALREVRYQGIEVGMGQHLALAASLALVAATMVLAVAGLSDWQSSWYCPGGSLPLQG